MAEREIMAEEEEVAGMAAFIVDWAVTMEREFFRSRKFRAVSELKSRRSK